MPMPMLYIKCLHLFHRCVLRVVYFCESVELKRLRLQFMDEQKRTRWKNTCVLCTRNKIKDGQNVCMRQTVLCVNQKIFISNK